MPTIAQLIVSSHPYSQLSQYVTLLQGCMAQQSNHNNPGANPKLILKQEKQMSRQGSHD